MGEYFIILSLSHWRQSCLFSDLTCLYISLIFWKYLILWFREQTFFSWHFTTNKVKKVFKDSLWVLYWCFIISVSRDLIFFILSFSLFWFFLTVIVPCVSCAAIQENCNQDIDWTWRRYSVFSLLHIVHHWARHPGVQSLQYSGSH